MISDSFTMRMDPTLRRRLKQAAADRNPEVSEAYVVHDILDKHLPALREDALKESRPAHPPRPAASKPVRYPPLRRRPKSRT